MIGSNSSGDLVFLTWLPDEADDDLEASMLRAYEAISRHLEAHGAVAIQERVFCDLEAENDILRIRADVIGRTGAGRVPPTLIQGAPSHGGLVAGIHVIAVRPSGRDPIATITWDERACGVRVSGAEADYLGLSDVGRALGAGDHDTPADETRDTLLLAARLLETQSWSFNDVCRTWFYLDDILSWYDEFNTSRNEVFAGLGLLNGSRPGTIPASTGICGRNPRGHRCTLDLLAVRPRPERPLTIEMLHNPLQNEAPEYGSAFSRGLTVATASCRTFLVSGTASIDETGATVHTADFESQTRRTLDNIESLLASRGAVMENICQATAFVKERGNIGRLRSILKARGLADLPVICTIDDICREDLLVEIDATAVIPLRSADNG
jgi:enamine deaminase RidA (YjgF/YER057c/UK114 family)